MENILMNFVEKRTSKIIAGEGLVGDIGGYLTNAYANKVPFVVTNPLIKQLHGEKLYSGLSRYGIQTEFIEVPDGEEHKSLSSASQIYDTLLKCKADRKTVLMSFGGGVIGDLTGFVAATYMRGVPLIHIPTTLLAQVDSSIGGKVAVDHPMAKNIIGSFYHPGMIFIDPALLVSLPLEHLRNGLAEIIKIAIILSPSLLTLIEKMIALALDKNMIALNTLIEEAVKLKVQLVLQDPWEKDKRKYLNFGHSIAHALEVIYGYQNLSHGEAVALGMVIETKISCFRGMCHFDLEKKVKNLVKKLNISFRIAMKNIDNEKVWKAIAYDKKNKRGKICFVLPEDIGKVNLVEDIHKEEIIHALEEFKKEWAGC